MLKMEHKLISFINKYMVHIAIGFIIFTAVYVRLAARNYVGYDFHFLLYDIPGNCGSVLYRGAVRWLTARTELVVPVLKMLAYFGDACVAMMTCVLLGREWLKKDLIRPFFVLSAVSLSPVVLEYSAAGMRLDSLCMALLLVNVYLLRKKKYPVAMCLTLAAAILCPAYWILVFAQLGFMVYLAVRLIKEKKAIGSVVLSGVLAGIVWAVSIFIERSTQAAVYFWGKVWVINRFSGVYFDSLWEWLGEMVMLYGYFAATSLLIYSVKNRKFRIPAIVMQVAVTMFVGWQQSGHMAI